MKPDLLQKVNTQHCTSWAVTKFMLWIEERNKRVPSEKMEPDIPDHELLCYILRLFVLEVRKSNGEKYPPGSIINLLSGIHRQIISNMVIQ